MSVAWGKVPAMERGPDERKVRFSPELQLALDCCAFGFRNGAAARPTPHHNIDWLRFLELVRFDRIEGIAWNALSAKDSLPHDVRSTLSQAASAIAAENLLAIVQCRALLEQFQSARVPLLFLKGLTTGALSYTNSAIKSALDIDLLIDPADLDRACELLRDCGYQLVAPQSRNAKALPRWHRQWKESVWAKDAPPSTIDLHTRTADNRRLIPTITVHSPSQFVELGIVSLPTLAPDELFAYLAVHGASSAWFRIKWISDFAGFLHDKSADEIERLYRRSQALGAGRASGQALLLADTLFGTLAGTPALSRELSSDRATQWLFEAALRLIAGEPVEPTERRLGTVAIHTTQFLMRPGIGFKISELRAQSARLMSRLLV